MCKGFDGTVAVLLDGHRLAFRVLVEGEAAVAVEYEKGVRDRVDAAKAAQTARQTGSRSRTIRGAGRSSPLRRSALRHEREFAIRFERPLPEQVRTPRP